MWKDVSHIGTTSRSFRPPPPPLGLSVLCLSIPFAAAARCGHRDGSVGGTVWWATGPRPRGRLQSNRQLRAAQPGLRPRPSLRPSLRPSSQYAAVARRGPDRKGGPSPCPCPSPSSTDKRLPPGARAGPFPPSFSFLPSSAFVRASIRRNEEKMCVFHLEWISTR